MNILVHKYKIYAKSFRTGRYEIVAHIWSMSATMAETAWRSRWKDIGEFDEYSCYAIRE